MAITAERVIARADMNDEYGVTVWTEGEMVDLTVEQARQFAVEVANAAAEAERVAREDSDAAFQSEGRSGELLRASSGEVVI